VVKVSVIIPVYNCEYYVREAIDSVLNQTSRDFEVIVINDGSTDKTEDILRQYGDQVRWKSQKNKGQAFAVNEGIKMAEGGYIAYLDADDVCLPERFENQVRYLDGHPDVGLVYSDFYQIDEYGNILRIKKSKPHDKFIFLQKNYIPRSAVMHRRECLNEVGLFDESITGSDDWDMWIRISEKFAMDYIGKPLVKYRVHKQNISLLRPKRFDHWRYMRMRILEKTHERQGRPFWLKLILMRAKIEWRIGKIPLLGEGFPQVWWVVNKILNGMERILIEKMLLNTIALQQNLLFALKYKHLPLLRKIKKKEYYRVSFKELKAILTEKDYNTDRSVFYAIFGKEDYKTNYRQSQVFDLGAHKGYYTLYALLEGASKVYSYEPEEFNFDILRENIELNKLSEKVVLYKCAVDSESGMKDFYVSSAGWSHSLFRRCDTTIVKRFKVRTQSINDVLASMDNKGKTIVKVDIEGKECDVIYSIDDALMQRISEFFIECHPFAPCSKEEMIEYLRGKQFKLVSISRDVLHFKEIRSGDGCC
jgi:FkbM family methyltransferase